MEPSWAVTHAPYSRLLPQGTKWLHGTLKFTIEWFLKKFGLDTESNLALLGR
jgi:hypothetical protein